MIETELEANLLHDLKNPLSGITGAVGLFSEGLLGTLNGEQMKFIGDIELSAKILANMLSDLQDIGNFEARQLTINRESFGADEIAGKIEWLGKIAVKEEKSVKIEAEKGVNLSGDKNLIARTAENILLNLIRLTDKGGVVVLKLSRKNKEVLFEISDKTSLIPPELSGQIFDKLFKVKNPKFKTLAGRGLGLYFAKLVAEAHGGKIRLEPQKGGGSKFSFTIPG